MIQEKYSKQSFTDYQKVANQDSELFMEVRKDITNAVDVTQKEFVQFDTSHGYILYSATGQRNRNSEMMNGCSKWVRTKKYLTFPIGFMLFFLIDIYPLGLCFSFGYMLFLWK